ncbi:MAG: cytidylate kinase family protein [Candidatus Eremiobacteraeota bacterium]|nr:cytidylate kinase family protein [Candidatus Eremiobacteraeota bacterium]
MIVTISREYGAAGLAVAAGTAHALGYGLLADDLPKTVASRLGTSSDAVAAIASADRSLPERLLEGLETGTAEVVSSAAPLLPTDYDESVRREIERAIMERAAAGNVVILGRNAGAVLGRRPDALRVYLTAERDWRAARIVASFGQSREAALADMDRIDAGRRRIAKERYKIVMGDARFYDLLLDVSCFGIEGAVSLVVSAVRFAEGSEPRT